MDRRAYGLQSVGSQLDTTKQVHFHSHLQYSSVLTLHEILCISHLLGLQAFTLGTTRTGSGFGSRSALVLQTFTLLPHPPA